MFTPDFSHMRAIASGLLTLLLISSTMTLSNGTHLIGSRSESSTTSPQATSDTINYDGIGPTTLSLYWAQSGDACFSSYTVQYSTSSSNGPWTTLATITSKTTTTEFVYRLAPSGTYWWQVIDTDCVGSAPSNTLQETQPSVATFAFTLSTETAAQFTWTNNAAYGGYVTFSSYQLMESINGGSYSVAATLNSESPMSYALNGLSPGTTYSFYLVTTDQCSTCSGGVIMSGSNSNTVAFTTPTVLGASANASPTTVSTGQVVSFTCAASGGVTPYTYTWTFGDGGTGTGQNPSHSYSSAGTENVVCTVTDSMGDTATSATAVTVTTQTILGQPQYTGYGIIAGIVGIALIGSLVVIRGRRVKATTGSSASPPTEGPTPSVLLCKSCGAPLPSDSQFCVKCGLPI